jgi:hypothetical protein
MSHVLKNQFLDIPLALETLAKYEEGKWFTPYNGDANDYDVCAELASMKLIARKVIPINMGGTRISFLYRQNMEFTND